MQFAQPKKDYLNWLLHEAKRAKTTHTTYQSWLNRYERWLPENGYPDPTLDDALSISNLRRYQYSLDAQNLGCRTIRAAFHPLRGLCEFLIKEVKVLTENPVNKLTMPQLTAAVRLCMSDKEALALLDAAERQTDPGRVAMSVALISALLYTGVRANELVNIKVADVLCDQEELMVSKGKGGKTRKLFPAPEFFVVVKAWLHERDKMGCQHDMLWAQGPRRSISYDWLLAHIEDLKAIAGYKAAPNIKPHSIRHWFATNLYRQTGNIKVVQRALGHSHPQTTYLYLHLDDEECRVMSKMTLGKPKTADIPSANAKKRLLVQPSRDQRASLASSDGQAKMMRKRRGSVRQPVRAR